MNDISRNLQIIEDTGKNYNEIIFHDDFIPSKVYLHQISLRDRIIENLLGQQQFNCILDLGCGTGFHLKTLSRHTENLIGVDMSFGALRECKKVHTGDYLVCDIKHLPFKSNTIDCIWIAGVLHHVPENLTEVISKNLAYVLNRGGCLIIDEPNRLNPLNYIILKLSRADPTGKEKPLSLYHVKKIIEDSRLKIGRADTYEFFGPFGLLLNNSHIFHLCEYVDLLLQRSIMRSFLLRWTILATKE